MPLPTCFNEMTSRVVNLQGAGCMTALLNKHSQVNKIINRFMRRVAEFYKYAAVQSAATCGEVWLQTKERYIPVDL